MSLKIDIYLKINYLYVLLLLILLLVLIISIQGYVVTFDAGMNFQVSENMVNNGLYATYYDKITLFDHNIQTGAPVILPTVLLNLIAGINQWNMLLVTTMYAFGFMCLVAYFIYKNTNLLIAIIGIISILLIPEVYVNFSIGYGEIAMGFWMFLGLLLLFKARASDKIYWWIFAGLTMGLGYLTKTVFLICIPAYSLLFLLDIFIYKKKKLYNYILLSLVFILTIFLFEIYKFANLGYQQYIAWWNFELASILGQAGLNQKFVSLHGSEKIMYHLSLYSEYFHMPILIVILFYLAPLIYFIFKFIKKHHAYIEIYLLYFISTTYFIWWLAILSTEKAWARRVILGHISIWIVIIIILGSIILTMLKNNQSKKYGVIITIILSILWGSVFYSYWPLLKTNRQVEYMKGQDAIVFSQIIKELPIEATIYGSGWWQCPVLSILSNRQFFDINNVVFLPKDSYLVMDFYSTVFAPYILDDLKSKYNLTVLESYNNQSIFIVTYKLDTTHEQFNLKQMLEDGVNISSIIIGAYSIENPGYFWAQDKIVIPLKNKHQSFVLHGYVPDYVETQVSGLNMYVYINDQLVESFFQKSDTNFEININEDKLKMFVSDDSFVVRIETDYNYKPFDYAINEDKRNLSYIINYIGQ